MVFTREVILSIYLVLHHSSTEVGPVTVNTILLLLLLLLTNDNLFRQKTIIFGSFLIYILNLMVLVYFIPQ
jgi:hypothetical protein